MKLHLENNHGTGMMTNKSTHRANLSSHMSGLMLSIEGLGGDDDDGDDKDSSQLVTLMNNSMRLSFHGNKAPPKYPTKASSYHNSNFSSSIHGSSEHSMGHGGSMMIGLDMSVATIGDKMSDFGDGSVARMMTESEMSFGNVFDEK